MNINFKDRQHISKVLQQQNIVGSIFSDFVKRVSPSLRKWKDNNSNSVWVRNSSIERDIDKEIQYLHDMLLMNIQEFQLDSWNSSQTKNDEMINAYLHDLALSATRREGYFKRNNDAFNAYISRKDKYGQSISEKVWNVAQQSKENLEFFLSTGMANGRSADEISRDVRQMLDNPDKRFRRVRDANGKLQLSKPMKDYHPGRGVYRSSKMNALRLTATETNRAYREADHSRWQDIDFIQGFKVSRSPMHHGPCPICDAMVGKYSKNFKFTGWHPFCICIATPIVPSEEDLADFLITGEVKEQKLYIPTKAQKFIKENKDVLGNSDWYRENAEYLGQKRRTSTISIKKEEKKERDLVALARARQAKRSEEEKKNIETLWENRKKTDEIVANIKDDIKKNYRIEYRKVELLKKKLSEKEIIEKLAGGDLTKGSCLSQAFAYFANKRGWDVTDYRGGVSQNYFALSYGRFLKNLPDIHIEKEFNDFVALKKHVAFMEENKEYMLIIARHCAVVKKVDGAVHYLELQSSTENGFKLWEKGTLKNRFKGKTSHKSKYFGKYEVTSALIDYDVFSRHASFRDMLGYINTESSRQQKGSKGTIK